MKEGSASILHVENCICKRNSEMSFIFGRGKAFGIKNFEFDNA